MPAVPPVGRGQLRTGPPGCRAPPGDGRDRSATDSGTEPLRDLLPSRLFLRRAGGGLAGRDALGYAPVDPIGAGTQGRPASQPFSQPRPARSGSPLSFRARPAGGRSPLGTEPRSRAPPPAPGTAPAAAPPGPARPRHSFVRTPRNKGAAADGAPRPLPSQHPPLTAPPRPRCRRLLQRSPVSAAPAAHALPPLAPQCRRRRPPASRRQPPPSPRHHAPLRPCAHTAILQRSALPSPCPHRAVLPPPLGTQTPAALSRTQLRGPSIPHSSSSELSAPRSPADTSSCRRGDAQRTILAVINSRKKCIYFPLATLHGLAQESERSGRTASQITAANVPLRCSAEPPYLCRERPCLPPLRPRVP